MTSLSTVRRIERLSCLLVAIVTLASLALRDGRATLGVALGGGLATLNFWGLRRILQGILRGRDVRRQGLLGALLAIKFAALAGALYVVIRYAPVHATALLVGFSLVVLAILVEGFRTVLGGATSAASPE